MPYRLGLFALNNGASRHADLIATMRAILEQMSGSPAPNPEPPTGGMPTGHMPTQLTSDGLILTPEGTPDRDVSDAIRTWFPREVWTDAARVSYHEARWDTTAERNTLAQAGGRCGVPIGTLDDGTPIVSEQSVGLYQINVCAHGHDREYWRDIMHNVAYASGLYQRNGWRDWVATAKKLGLN